jgi:hypothetical protein
MKGISKKSKHVTRKISNKKKYGKSKSGKKSKKVLISKLVTRNKLKKMMKGGANIKYDELKAKIETGQPLTIIDLSYVEPSTAQPIQQEEPEQKSQGWFGGITSGLFSFYNNSSEYFSLLNLILYQYSSLGRVESSKLFEVKNESVF